MKVNSSPQSVARSEQEAPAEKQGGCQEPDPGGVSSGQSEGWGEYRAARREEENVFFFLLLKLAQILQKASLL